MGIATTNKPEDDELDLPALDGEESAESAEVHEDLDGHDELERNDGDALDDAAAGGDPGESLVVEGAEGGWLVEAEDATNADVGPIDLSLGGDSPTEGKLLADDEPEAVTADDDLGGEEGEALADGGEEGPLADDEELREEDLPALDADDDGEVADEALYDRALLADDELKWVDRAWRRAPDAVAAGAESDDSGVLAVPGEDAEANPRDATWRRYEAGGQLSAAAFLPGGAVVVALARSDRAWLVRILPDGSAGIIAEIEPRPGLEDEDATHVTSLRWTDGVLVATGPFGTQAFEPT